MGGSRHVTWTSTLEGGQEKQGVMLERHAVSRTLASRDAFKGYETYHAACHPVSDARAIC